MKSAIALNLKALDNESALDQTYCLNLQKISGRRQLPFRPYRIQARFEKHPLLVKWCLNFVNLFWLFPLAPALYTVQWFRFFLTSNGSVSRDVDFKNKTVLLGFSSASQVVLDNYKPNIVVTAPWVSLKVPREKAFPLFQNASFWLTFKSYICCLATLPRLCFRKGRWPYMVQSYDNFRWFMSYWCLQEILNQKPSEFWFSNHFDRWAVLSDGVEGPTSRTLFQHGLFEDQLYVPQRLSNVDTFYYLRKASVAFFKEGIFAPGLCPKERAFLEAFQVNTELYHNKSVLIIAQPHVFGKEKEIAERLNSHPSVEKIYIKPHPLYSDEKYRNLPLDKLEVVTEAPKIDVAITFASTLGAKYENLGTPVVWHRGLSIVETIDQAIGHLEKALTNSESLT